MSCCSAKTAVDKLEPFALRAHYIRQIQRLAQKGIFGQAVNVFREVCLLFSFASIYMTHSLNSFPSHALGMTYNYVDSHVLHRTIEFRNNTLSIRYQFFPRFITNMFEGILRRLFGG